MNNLPQKIKNIRASIVAIGFNPTADQITILGSGFLAQGKVITCAHLLNNLTEEQIRNLKANILMETTAPNVEKYQWVPISILPDKKDMQNDLAIFEFSERPRGLQDLALGDSEEAEVGQDIYFIGFPYAAQLINDGFGLTLVVNKGIISNVKRDNENKRAWLIIDAISNPGNSGCPLIDAETNEVIGVISISFRTPSQAFKEVTSKLLGTPQELDIREPMHIAGAKPINLVKELLK